MEPDEIKMTFFQMLGSYKWPLLIIAMLIVAITLYDVILIWSRANQERIKHGLKAILVTGSMCAALGITAQIHGIWLAIQAIIEAADVSPMIVMFGLKVSFASTLFGLASFVVSGVFWLAVSYWNSFHLKESD